MGEGTERSTDLLRRVEVTRGVDSPVLAPPSAGYRVRRLTEGPAGRGRTAASTQRGFRLGQGLEGFPMSLSLTPPISIWTAQSRRSGANAPGQSRRPGVLSLRQDVWFEPDSFAKNTTPNCQHPPSRGPFGGPPFVVSFRRHALPVSVRHDGGTRLAGRDALRPAAMRRIKIKCLRLAGLEGALGLALERTQRTVAAPPSQLHLAPAASFSAHAHLRSFRTPIYKVARPFAKLHAHLLVRSSRKRTRTHSKTTPAPTGAPCHWAPADKAPAAPIVESGSNQTARRPAWPGETRRHA